jgi:hypothetical protein
VGSFVSRRETKLNFILGLIAGAAYLTKITGLMLIPIWVVFIVIYFYRFRVRPGMTLKSILVFAIGFILTAGWYLVRNFRLYGNLLETDAAIKHFGRPAMQLEVSGPINYWIGFIQTNFKTFFSGYGMLTVNLPDGILFLLLVILLIGFWGILVKWLANLDCHIPPKARLAMTEKDYFLAASAILIILGHVLVNIKVEAFHARDLFVGMAPFSLMFVLGMETWWQKFKTGRLWNHKVIYVLMTILVYVLTEFHFQQQALVYVIKSVVGGRQIGLEPVLSVAAVSAVFVLAWMIFVTKSKNFCAAASNFLKSGRNKSEMIWGLAAGLFAINLVIIFGLVIPRLYSLGYQ